MQIFFEKRVLMCYIVVNDSHTAYVSLLLDNKKFSAFLTNVFKCEIIWRALLNHVHFAIRSFSVYLYFEGPSKVSGNVYMCLRYRFCFLQFPNGFLELFRGCGYVFVFILFRNLHVPSTHKLKMAT